MESVEESRKLRGRESIIFSRFFFQFEIKPFVTSLTFDFSLLAAYKSTVSAKLYRHRLVQSTKVFQSQESSSRPDVQFASQPSESLSFLSKGLT